MLSRAPGAFSATGASETPGTEHVTDLAGEPAGAAKEVATQEDAGADPGADGKEGEVGRVLRGAGPAFGEGGDVDVVVDGSGDVEGGFEQCLQRNVAPAEEVGGGYDDAAVDVGKAGRTDGDAHERGAGQVEIGEQGGRAFYDERDDVVGVADADGGGGPPGAQLACGEGEGEAQVGAAEIDAEDVRRGRGDVLWGSEDLFGLPGMSSVLRSRTWPRVACCHSRVACCHSG